MMCVGTQAGGVVLLKTPTGRDIDARHWAFPGLIADSEVPCAEVRIHEVSVLVVYSDESIEDGDGLSLMCELTVEITDEDGVRAV